MAFCVAEKVAWVECEYELAQSAGFTLLEQLTSTRRDWKETIATGKTVSSTQANTVQVAFSEPGKGAPTPRELFYLAAEMMTRYDTAVAALTTPTDAQIVAQMVSTMGTPLGQGARSVRTNFSLMYA